MDKFLCMQAFVRVAETKSFVAAARQLRVTPSVITSRVKQLERYVNAPLFHRSTRKVALSEVAEDFFDECVQLLGSIESMTDRLRQTKDAPLGQLRVQVLPGFATGPFAQALREFSIEFPHISLEITVSDRSLNPVGEGYDVSLQIFRPEAEVLIERKLFAVRHVFCASPQYLLMRGTPSQPNHLLRHDIGLYSSYPTRNRWTFRCNNEETVVDLPTRMHSNSVALLRDFARAGGGIACLPTHVCSEDLVNGTLVPLLTDYDSPSMDLFAIYPSTHRGTAKVKSFVDFMSRRFAGEPAWDRALHDVPECRRMFFSRERLKIAKQSTPVRIPATESKDNLRVMSCSA